jgi:hypothetical protein
VTEISTPRIPFLDAFDADRIDLLGGIPFVTGSGPRSPRQTVG